MQELIKQVSTGAGLTEEQAKKSIEIVAAYIKERLPESFRSQIDHLVNGDKLSDGMKAKLNEVASEMRDSAEDFIKDVRDKAEEVAGKIREMFSEDRNQKPGN